MNLREEVLYKLNIDLNKTVIIHDNLVNFLGLKTNYDIFRKIHDLIIDKYTDHKILYSDSNYLDNNFIYSFNESFYNFLDKNNIKNPNGFYSEYDIAKILTNFVNPKILITI
jgi:hypothetical protein